MGQGPPAAAAFWGGRVTQVLSTEESRILCTPPAVPIHWPDARGTVQQGLQIISFPSERCAALRCLLQSPSSRRQTITRALRPSRPSPVLRCEARRGETRASPLPPRPHSQDASKAQQSITQTTCRAAGGRGEVLLHMQCPLVEQGYDRPQVPRPAAS